MGNMLIVITGFMGSGKSAVASALSRHFECEVIDLDEAIAASEGRTAKQIIDESGEDYLYPAEYFVVIEVPRQTAWVLTKSFTRGDQHAASRSAPSYRRPVAALPGAERTRLSGSR